MAKIRSLSQQLTLQLWVIGFALFLAVALVLSIFSYRFISVTTENLLLLDAESIVIRAHEDPNYVLPKQNSLSAYREWEQLPDLVRSQFSENDLPLLQDKVFERRFVNTLGEDEYLYVMHYWTADFGSLFLVSRHGASEIDRIFMRFISSSFQQAFVSALIVFGAVFFLIFWLLRRSTEPLHWLNDWARELKADQALPLKADFPIRELNELAEQLRSSVDQIEAYNRREQEFLRYASHELRTPLGIIQASLDTIELISVPKQKTAIDRAQKASQNVRALTSTLLWVARENGRMLDVSSIIIKDLLDEIAQEHHLLLAGREIVLTLSSDSQCLQLEREPLKVVLSNVIRNAFQYGAGNINITADKQRIQMRNQKSEHSIQNQEGFGVGLELTRRLCEKLTWQFYSVDEDGYVTVTIVFTSDTVPL